MAEAKKKDGAHEAGAANPAGNKKKLIIVMAVVTLLTIGISVGVTVFLLGGAKEDAKGDKSGHEAEAVAGKGPAIYLAIEPSFLVTLEDNARQRYMKVDLSVQARQKASVDAVTHHMPLIRSRVLSYYSSTKLIEVQTDAGKQKMIEKTLEEINSVLTSEGAPSIENVFFTNFVLQ